MKIKSVELNNFRIYKGKTVIEFPFKSKDKNVFLISGKNGFGKTSFLTSLVWAFYGQLMVQVEDKYKNDVKKAGGYAKFLKTQVNKDVLKSGIKYFHNSKLMSVTVEMEDITIPSVPCKTVSVKREFNFELERERLTVLIDGMENELTKEVGSEIFINDFILPREIAKFFFFDSEKIVSLAEAKSVNELRTLSKAYSEVLGIKKYEDLKSNLTTLLTKLKRAGANASEKAKMEKLSKELALLEDEEKEIDLGLVDLETDFNSTNERFNEIQEELVRSGSGISLETLNKYKEEKEEFQKELDLIKVQHKGMMDLLPFLLAGDTFTKMYERAKEEQNLVSDQSGLLQNFKQLSSLLLYKIQNTQFKDELTESLKEIKEELENNSKNSSDKDGILLEQSPEEFRKLEGLYNHINGEYKNQLQAIKKAEKDLRLKITRITQKITQAESKEKNHVIEELRSQRDELALRSQNIALEIGKQKAKQDLLNTQIKSKRKVLSELEKNFTLQATDVKKYEVTQGLLIKVEQLMDQLKKEKKLRLEQKILNGLNQLMHKDAFVTKVVVQINDDIMDIDLIDENGRTINKVDLSKGEQQLYATAVLKALVDESGIQFPVFIDSPLQKFDKDHSKNIIKEFYPHVSSQVVVFPLLEKELNRDEYNVMKPFLSGTYLIQNYGVKGSTIEKVAINQLFTKFNQEEAHVLAH